MSFKKSILTLALSSALFACGEKTTEEHLAEADKLIAEQKFNTAIIELKNAIKTAPNNSDIRYKLALTYIEMSDLKAAEKELSAALNNGHDVNLVLPDLGFVFSLLHDNESILDFDFDEYELTEQARSEINFYKGLSSFRLRNFDEAKRYFDDASKLNKDGKYAQLASLYNYSPLENALPLAESLIDLHPEFFHALYFKGIVNLNMRDSEQAVEAFSQIDTLMPQYSVNYLYLANALIQGKQYDKATPYIDRFLKVNKDHPFANQLKAIVLYNDNQLEASQRHIEKAIQLGLNTQPNRLLAGMIAFEQQQYEQAHQYLAALVDSLSQNHPATRAFFATQLELGYLEEAKSLLTENFNDTPLKNELAAALSYKIFQSGDTEGSKQILKNIDSSEDSKVSTQIGLLKLSMNDMSGIDDLLKAKSAQPDQIEVVQALAASYVQAGKPEKAIATIKEYQNNNSEKADGYRLEGYFLLNMGRLEEALNAFNQALEIKSDDETSLFYSARIHQQNKQVVRAQELIDLLLSINPNNIQGLSLNFTLAKQESSSEQNIANAIAKLKTAAENNDDKTIYKEAYVAALLSSKQYKAVIDAVSSHQRKLDQLSEPLWLALTQSNALLNGPKEAIATLKEWAESAESNIKAWSLYIDALVQAGASGEAVKAANKALLLTNDNPQLKVKLINILVATNQLDLAERHLTDLPADEQNSELVQMIKARLLINKRAFSDALAILTPLYKQNPDEQTSVMMFLAYIGSKQLAQSEQFASKHVENHPEHLQVRMLLANLLLQSNPAIATKQYEYVVERDTDNITALNNLSYLLKENGEMSRAQFFIEKAVELAPTNPSVLDTAGTIYIAQGAKSQAIETLSKAVELAPNNTTYLAHLEQAKAL